MKIRIGYQLAFECPQPTFMVLMLSVHASRRGDLVTDDAMSTEPPVHLAGYDDAFGNRCTRLMAPAGTLRIHADALIHDNGAPDPVVPGARETPLEQLPDDALVFLLASRYCDTERLMDVAWKAFGGTAPGWPRVQAICDYVHDRLTFGYAFARPTKTAYDAHAERQGVCRDFAHLAIALCRCMNIPARYCTGYLGDIGVPVAGEMDYSAWMEVYLGGQWRTMDARHNRPRIGRVMMAVGRDAVDVPIANTFGPAELVWFEDTTV